MSTAGAAGITGNTNDGTAFNSPTSRHIHAGQVPVERAIAIAMLDNHCTSRGLTAIIRVASEDDQTGCSSQYPIWWSHCIIPTGMTIVGKSRVGFGTPPERM
jgi:hypothetical protein